MNNPATKIKAIAVDDELHCLDTLHYEINRHCPYVEIVASYQDPEEAYKALKEANVDVVFMDIHLKSTSGIELIERLLPCDFHIVFTTAYDEYALKAFDLAASHYLLKPINGHKLKEAMERILAGKENQEKINMESFVKRVKQELKSSDKIAFPVASGVEFLDPHDIIYVEGDNNYSIIYLREGEKLVISKTLSVTEETLANYSFLRIHKSFLINLNYLKSYSKSDGGYVIMEGGKQLSVSRSKKLAINDLYK